LAGSTATRAPGTVHRFAGNEGDGSGLALMRAVAEPPIARHVRNRPVSAPADAEANWRTAGPSPLGLPTIRSRNKAREGEAMRVLPLIRVRDSAEPPGALLRSPCVQHEESPP